MIKLIWAQTPSGVIGNHNQLPWKIPEEMQHFRHTTLNHDVLMGRKTFASMNFKPLPKRFNYILTHQKNSVNGSGYQYINDIQKLIPTYQHSTKSDLYVIGGKEIIKLFFPLADEVIVSVIKKEYPGTIRLDALDWDLYHLMKTQNQAEFTIQYWQKNHKN